MIDFNLTDIAQMDRTLRLHLINSCTGIKPANLIGTVDAEGRENLAIFSSVVHLGSNPPYLGFVMRPQTDVKKDTYQNISTSGYYTINHVPVEMIKNAHYTSAKFDSEVNEFERCQIESEYREDFPAPFVKEAPVKIGLRKVNEIPIPENGTILMVGIIERLIVPERVLDFEGKINLQQIRTAGISGLNTYYGLTKLEEFPYVRVKEVPEFN